MRYLPKGERHTHTLIMMHGLGGAAEKYRDLFDWQEFKDDAMLAVEGVKVVLPQAPANPIASWYDYNKSTRADRLKLVKEWASAGKEA